MKKCERCERVCGVGTRRFRCTSCESLVCVRCCFRGGSGQGQGSVRWAECFDCQRTREERPTFSRVVSEAEHYGDEQEREQDHLNGAKARAEAEAPVDTQPANALPGGRVAWCDPKPAEVVTVADVDAMLEDLLAI